MQTPEPVREHRVLEKLAGHFSGPERMHPSYWNDEAQKGEAVTDARVALDGFAVVQDYEQRLEDGSRFAGHGVFRYDMASETYEMHWFDSTGGPERIFRGGFSGNRLVLTARAGDGWQRLTYDFSLRKGYRLKLETSDDGQDWNVALEGDNIAAGKAARSSAARKRTAAGKKAVAKVKPAAGAKSSARKKPVAGKKTAAKKKAAVGRKASTTKKAATRKKPARAATARKASAKKKAAAKSTARGVTRKKSAARKAGATRTASKKMSAKKTAGRKAATGKATTGKKAAARKPAGKKTAAKKTARKAAPRTSPGKKAATGKKRTVAGIEKARRQGKASRKIGGTRHARGDGSSASARAPVSQKRSKGAAHKAPRTPSLKSTSTRVGWHKTAAKGVPGS